MKMMNLLTGILDVYEVILITNPCPTCVRKSRFGHTDVDICVYRARVIYTRFRSKSADLLRRIKIQNKEAQTKHQ